MCSNLVVKTYSGFIWLRFGVFVNFEHILVLSVLLEVLNVYLDQSYG